LAAIPVISLDTNYLILGLVADSRESDQMVAWHQQGEQLCTSTVCWYEFLCGPVHEQHVAVVLAVLHEVLPFDVRQATEAARLFNAVERRRSLRVDSMIAATAIVPGALLATNNPEDFRPFVQHGLRLLSN
jgi:predicted nucleic acid-binding protein